MGDDQINSSAAPKADTGERSSGGVFIDIDEVNQRSPALLKRGAILTCSGREKSDADVELDNSDNSNKECT
jgi:hypothetical protein